MTVHLNGRSLFWLSYCVISTGSSTATEGRYWCWAGKYSWDWVLQVSPMFEKKNLIMSLWLQYHFSIVMSFTELGPKLLRKPGAEYLLSEVFSQDPLERYFSRQRHRGGSNDNPTAYQVPFNANTLLQQQSVYRDLKTERQSRWSNSVPTTT